LVQMLTKGSRTIATRFNNREAVPLLHVLTKRGRTIATRVNNREVVPLLHLLTTERLYHYYTC